MAGIGKSAELPRFGDGALGVLQDIHRAVDADQHLELAGRHARVSTELAQGSKLVDMDDLGDLREGTGDIVVLSSESASYRLSSI